MRTDSRISTVPTDFRGLPVHRHKARRYAKGRAFAVSTGLGFPRLWESCTSQVLDGFEEGLVRHANARIDVKLELAFQHARETLAQFCRKLIEASLPETGLTAVILESDALHVMSAGPGRLYIYSGGQTKRLTAREESAGILEGRPVQSRSSLDPRDLLLLGTEPAFSSSAIAKIKAILGEDANARPAILADVLTAPAARAGTGAAAIAIRVE